ncbi:MAG: hypothetical protein ACREFK_15820 [Stellaceae bacterium]
MNKKMRLLSFAVIALTALAVTPTRAQEPQRHPPPAKRAPYHPPAHLRAVRPGVPTRIPTRPGLQGYYARPGFARPPGVHPEGFARSTRSFTAPQWRGRMDFRGRSIRTLHPDQRALWRGGGWQHARHQGRFGWWWVVGGAWYFYPAPVYPYPLYASSTVFFEPAVAAPAGPPIPYRYYCGYPAGYYPYVQNCAYPWQPVPASPE